MLALAPRKAPGDTSRALGGASWRYDENAVADDDGGRGAPGRQVRPPGHVLGLGPRQRQAGLRGRAVEVRPAPMRPVGGERRGRAKDTSDKGHETCHAGLHRGRVATRGRGERLSLIRSATCRQRRPDKKSKKNVCDFGQNTPIEYGRHVAVARRGVFACSFPARRQSGSTVTRRRSRKTRVRSAQNAPLRYIGA